MVASNTVQVEEETERATVAFAGGALIPLCAAFPRTCIEALPTVIRSAHDTDGDNIADLVITSRIRLIDVDGDGVIRRGCDALHVRPTEAEAIQAGNLLLVGPRQHEEAIERARGL